MNTSRKNAKRQSRKLKKVAKRFAAYSAAAAVNRREESFSPVKHESAHQKGL